MLFLLLFILFLYVAYNHLFAYQQLQFKTISHLISDHFWIFNKKGKMLYASNDAFIDFDDFIQKFEKCFHVYGQKNEVIQKLINFEPFEIVLQKKANQQFYNCIFQQVNSFFIFYLEKTNEVDESLQPSSFNFFEQVSLGFIVSDQNHSIVYSNTFAQELLCFSSQTQKLPDHLPKDQKGFHHLSENLSCHVHEFEQHLTLYTIFPNTLSMHSSESSFDLSRIPSLIMDKDGNIQKKNHAFIQMLQNFEISIESNFFELMDKTRKSEVKNKYQRVCENKNLVDPFETHFSNQELIMTTYTSRLFESQSFLLQFIDISEQKQLRQQFIQSQKMQAVGQLAGGIAHDFNNILTAIIGFSDLLLQKYLPNDPSYGDLIQIKQNANRASNLVRQLLAFSRQQNLQPTVLSVGDVLSELSALLHRLLGAKIELQVKHGKNIHPVKTDLSQLEQVIINLAVNARDAMEYSGKLIITTENFETAKDVRVGHDTVPKGQYVTISVQDTGCGIPPENLPHIFEPFFTTKKISSGTGLGLSTVYGIVKQTGGFISVHSEVSKGSTFTIYIPAVDDAILIPQNVKKTIIDLTGKERILLVEDEDAVRTFTARALREKGYEVSEAASGKEALTMVQAGCLFDLIVTDVVMPEIDGPTFIQEVRKEKPDTKTIFISGYSDETFNYALADDDKLTFFLPKPFNIKDLATKVKTSLQAS